MKGISPIEKFGHILPYRFLPFKFVRSTESEYFLTNIVGEYCFLKAVDFNSFIHKSLPVASSTYKELKSKHFLFDSESTLPIELLAIKYRTKRAFMEGFARLHIFILTLRCDHNCHYCAALSVPADQRGFDMSSETARRAVDLMLSCPSDSMKVEFQGGEPLLNFDTLRFICDYSKEKAGDQKRLEYVVCTNLASLDSQKIDYLKKNSILISTSLDGPKYIHDGNRCYSGGSSYDITVKNILNIMSELGKDRISALMTTSALSIKHPKEIVDEYVAIGFNSIFLRSIRPYGRSRTPESRYTVSEYLSFYRQALEHIISLNRQGVHIIESFAQILLIKILTPFAAGFVDLQSPTGSGMSFVAYDYDGDVYASDEARMLAKMGDRTFRMGSVHEDSYREIFGGPTIRAIIENSCVEVMPGCSDCPYQVYCGADPIHYYTTQGDLIGHRPTSDFCQLNRGIIQLLFDYLYNGDEFIQDLFLSWVAKRYMKSEIK